jgi:hypothetical protein
MISNAMPSTEIEDYEPPDKGWIVRVGRFLPRPETPKPEEDKDPPDREEETT